MEELKLRARLCNWGDRIELLAYFLNTNGNRSIAKVSFDETEQGALVNPTLEIDRHAAQALMDDLWQAGLRPSEGSGSAGSLLATQKHLEDMRKIAFKKLSIT